MGLTGLRNSFISQDFFHFHNHLLMLTKAEILLTHSHFCVCVCACSCVLGHLHLLELADTISAEKHCCNIELLNGKQNKKQTPGAMKTDTKLHRHNCHKKHILFFTLLLTLLGHQELNIMD